MKSFFLVGYFGFGNFGDSLILETFLENTKGLSSRTSFLSGPITEMWIHGKQGILPIQRWDILSLLRILMNCSISFVVPGGELFQIRTSRRSFLYYYSLLRLASRSGHMTFLLFQGVDNRIFEERKFGLFWNRLIQGCSLFFGRDQRTIPDILFLRKLSRVVPGKEKKILVALSGKPCSHLDAIESLLKDFSKDGWTFRFVVFHVREDFRLAKKLQESVGGEIIHPNRTVSPLYEVERIFEGMHACFATRYHAAVISLAKGIRLYYPPLDAKANGLNSYILKNRGYSRMSQRTILSRWASLSKQSALESFRKTLLSPATIRQFSADAHSAFGRFVASWRQS